MALDTITLHGEILAPVTNTPAVGTVTFKIVEELRDNADNVIYSPQTFVATLDVNGEFSIVLPVTDDPTVTPLNWSYWCYVNTDIWVSGVFYFQLPASLGPVAEFADIIGVDGEGFSCTPDGTACAPIGAIGALQAQIDDLESQITGFQDQIDALDGRLDIVEADIIAIQADILTIQGQITTIQGQITTLQGQVATNTADIITIQGQITTLQGDVSTLQTTVGALVGQVNTISPIVFLNQANIATLQGQILNIDAAWITTGTLAYQRLGGNIVEADTVSFNRPTLVNPPTAADTWQFRYNGNRVTYVNEFACFRVRGIPDNQVPARIMSNAARDNTNLPSFQVTLSDATTHWFQVLADGQILGPNSLSMLPTTATAVTFTGNMGNAALINDGVGANTGAPYPVTTTLYAADNRVFLDGNMANNGGVSIPAQTTLFTIAAAHRPTAWCQFSLRTSTNLAVRLTIKGATGIVVADQAMAAGATINLDGLNFRKS